MISIPLTKINWYKYEEENKIKQNKIFCRKIQIKAISYAWNDDFIISPISVELVFELHKEEQNNREKNKIETECLELQFEPNITH